ncbi:hypothetical protein HpDR24_04610 [Helicobacter pylori]
MSSFYQHSPINVKLAPKQTLAVKILFQFETLIPCKNFKFQKNKQTTPLNCIMKTL